MKKTDASLQDIAVIGMAGRFPKADSVDEFWENLIEGKDCITRKEPLVTVREGYETVNAFGAINTPFHFDNDFFGITSAEALNMEPQERVLLECTYHALEDAGYMPDDYDGKIGIVCGAQENEYYYKDRFENKKKNLLLVEAEKFMNSGSALTGRISYKLNLTGPSVIVSTTCATSLTAVHMAVKMLQNQEADLMLAGGANITLNQESYVAMEGAVSKEGVVRPFDKDGTGLVPGNAVAVVVLKKLEDAVRDGDDIYAVVKGSAIGNDGSRKIGFTAPSVKGQLEVIKKAIETAGIDETDMDYIETHGTATPLGDAVEIRALHGVYQDKVPKKSLAIGSVKGNCGHMNCSAGIAGFIKGALILKYGVIPPSIHHKNDNEEITEQSPLYVCSELTELSQKEGSHYVGVSSFGLGGINAHMILGSYEEGEKKEKESKEKPEIIFMFPGTGSDYSEMAKELYEKSGEFKKYYEECSQAVKEITGETLEKLITENVSFQTLKVLAVSYSLAKMLIDYGIKPDKVMGYSLGEYSLAAVSGIMDLNTAITLVYQRTKLIEKLPEGRMFAVAAKYEKIKNILPEGVFLAGYNADDRVILSCTMPYYEQLKEILKKNRCIFQEVDIHKPAHSPVMRQIEQGYIKELEQMTFGNSKFSLISGNTGGLVEANHFSNPAYWIDQMTNEVKFSPGILTVLNENVRNKIFLEVGPGDQLSSMAKRHWKGKDKVSSYALIDGQKEEWAGVLDVLGELRRQKADLNLKPLIRPKDFRRAHIPGYKFQRNYFNLFQQEEQEKNLDIEITQKDLMMFSKFMQEQDEKRHVKSLKEYAGLYEAYEKLCITAAAEYLKQNKIRPQIDYENEALFQQLSVIPECKEFVNFLIRILEEKGLAQKTKANVAFTEEIFQLADFDIVINDTCDQFPQFEAFIRLFETCVQNYNNVFTGEVIGNSILYPDGKYDRLYEVDRLVPETEQILTYIRIFPSILHHIISKSDRTLKILEIGAGTGRLTWPLLEALRDQKIEYWFTDIGASFIAEAKREAERRKIKNIKFSTFNIEKPLEQAGFHRGEFDFIIGLDVIQATTDIEQTVQNLKGLVKKNGWMIMLQTFQMHPIISMIYGFAPGWWNYEKDVRRSGKSICSDAEQWTALYNENGFEEVRVLQQKHFDEAGIIFAKKVFEEERFTETEPLTEHKEKDMQIETEQAEDMTEVENKVLHLMQETVGERTVRMTDCIYDIGIDSLSVLIIKAKLQEYFRMEMTVRELYSCKTIKEIAELINERKGQSGTASDMKEVKKKPAKSLTDLFQKAKGKE